MVQRAVTGLILCFLIFQEVMTQSLVIRDVRGSGKRWQAHITRIEFSSIVDGLFARNEMTLSIKDTLSYTNMDSMEVTLDFNLPKDAVIDSMYLWINGEPEPAYMKSALKATQIYESIVKRRVDPALLKKNGSSDNYTVKIFPFVSREKRKIKICYTTILNPVNDKLLLEIPVNITSASCFPARDIVFKAMLKDIPKQNIVVSSNIQSKFNFFSFLNNTIVQFADQNNKYKNPLHVLINSPGYSGDGCIVNVSKDVNGETFFTTVLDPGKMLGFKQNNRRKILIVWNNVLMKNTNDGFYRYYRTYHERDKDDILNFITTCIQPGDQFNLVTNGHNILSYKGRLVPFKSEYLPEIADFLNNSTPTTSKNSGCTSPLELLYTGFSCLENQDSVVIIIIDKNRHFINSSYDTASITGSVNYLIGRIPKTTRIYGFFDTGSRSYITKSYTQILESIQGHITPTGMKSSLKNVLKNTFYNRSERIYPVSITFSDNATGYPYDIIEPSNDRLYLRSPCIYTGRMNDSKEMKIEFNGVVQGKNYRFSKIFEIQKYLSSIPTMSDYWAGLKVEEILSRSNTFSEKSKALDISLQYRILTPLTALLALEKWLADSLNMSDAKPKKIDTLAYNNNNDNNNSDNNEQYTPTPTIDKPVTMINKFAMTCICTKNSLSISITYFSQIKGEKYISLKVYDLKGRLKADLTKKLIEGRGTFKWKTGTLPAGMYIIRLKIGSKIINRQIYISH